jgi:hypothetical protein
MEIAAQKKVDKRTHDLELNYQVNSAQALSLNYAKNTASLSLPQMT